MRFRPLYIVRIGAIDPNQRRMGMVSFVGDRPPTTVEVLAALEATRDRDDAILDDPDYTARLMAAVRRLGVPDVGPGLAGPEAAEVRDLRGCVEVTATECVEAAEAEAGDAATETMAPILNPEG